MLPIAPLPVAGLLLGVGSSFNNLALFGILQGNAKTLWIWIVIVGLVYFVVYYFTFYLMITKMDLKTPSWEDEGEGGGGGDQTLHPLRLQS